MVMRVLKPLLSFFKTNENRCGRGGPAAETILPWADPSTPPPAGERFRACSFVFLLELGT